MSFESNYATLHGKYEAFDFTFQPILNWIENFCDITEEKCRQQKS